MTEDPTQIAVAWKHTGAVRLVATSEPGAPVESLVLDAEEIVAGSPRRLDLATLGDLPPRPYEPRDQPAIALDDAAQERILTIAAEQGVAISTFVSEGRHGARLHELRSRSKRDLAVGQRPIVAAAIAPNGKSAIVLDEGGLVLRYDLPTRAFPASVSAREPSAGKRACLDIGLDGRLWLSASAGWIEVRRMRDAEPLATVDLSPLGEDVTSVRFLRDGRGFLAGTSRGVVRRFELLVDHVGTTREARVAVIADAVDAAIARTRWDRYEPRVDVYDERSAESGLTTLYFVADHYESHQAQSGSDWAEHVLCAGHATFDGDRCVEAVVATTDRRRLGEREDETYDSDAVFAAFRAETAKVRSSSTVIAGGDAIKRAFDAHFASDRLSLPEKCLHGVSGAFSDNGWNVGYRFGKEGRLAFVDVYARNRMTNDRLYRVYQDGRVIMVGSSTEGALEDSDRSFYEEVRRRFG